MDTNAAKVIYGEKESS